VHGRRGKYERLTPRIGLIDIYYVYIHFIWEVFYIIYYYIRDYICTRYAITETDSLYRVLGYFIYITMGTLVNYLLLYINNVIYT